MPLLKEHQTPTFELQIYAPTNSYHITYIAQGFSLSLDLSLQHNDNQALKPPFEGCHNWPMSWPLQAAKAASSISAWEMPLLHMLAKALMCFMPYCVNDPQWLSNDRTIDFKHAQSSTSGLPGDLTELRTEPPFCGPQRSDPIISMLLSKCVLCLVVSFIWFRISLFLFPDSDLLYCPQKKRKKKNRCKFTHSKMENAQEHHWF